MPDWSIWLLVVVGVYAALVAAVALAAGPARAREVARFIPDCAVLFGRLLRDPIVPRGPKVALGLAAAYLASPIDVVPDFIPVAGQLDDAVIVAVVLRWLVRAAGAEPVARNWPGPDASLRALLRLAGAGAARGTVDSRNGHARDDGADHDAPDGGVRDGGRGARVEQEGRRPRRAR